LYDIDDLRVGMSVLVGRVSDTYVIMNKVSNMPRAGVSYSMRYIPPPVVYWDDDFTGADGSILDPYKWIASYALQRQDNRLESISGMIVRAISRGILNISTDPFEVSIETGIDGGSVDFIYRWWLHTAGFTCFLLDNLLPDQYPKGHFCFYQCFDEFTGERFLKAYLLEEYYYELPTISLNPLVYVYYLKMIYTVGSISLYYSEDGISYTLFGSFTALVQPYLVVSLQLYNYPSGGIPASEYVYVDNFKYISGAPPEEPKWSSPGYIFEGVWVISHNYIAYKSHIIYHGIYYVCKISHTSSSTNEPGVGVDWTSYWEVKGGL
jgi:hypothetical protein